MIARFTESLSSLLRKAVNGTKRAQVILFLLIVSPVVLVAVIGFIGTYNHLTDATLSGRESLARLAATTFEQRLERVIDIGKSLATRVRFRQLLHEGQWAQAIEILKDVPWDFPSIDRVFLTDRAGTLMADIPALPGVRGRNFAFRDWYRGVSTSWKPYVSNAYQRAAEPRLNVVALAFPIKAPQTETIIGILVLQVELNQLVKWSDSIRIGSSGHVYFVDRQGQLAAHPRTPSQSKLIDYSNDPIVQKALRGESGVETTVDLFEGNERVAAYAPVPGIGWAVIASEPIGTAFGRRNRALTQLFLRHIIIFFNKDPGFTQTKSIDAKW